MATIYDLTMSISELPRRSALEVIIATRQNRRIPKRKTKPAKKKDPVVSSRAVFNQLTHAQKQAIIHLLQAEIEGAANV
jgi:hypothetical protein